MGILFLEATGAGLSTAAFRSKAVALRAEWILSISVQPRSMERLKLTTGEKISTVGMTVTFRVSDPVHLDYAAERSGKPVEEICGAAHYFEGRAARDDLDADDPAIIMETFVAQETMDMLMSLARHGRYPRNLTVTIEGLTHDYPPDGITWDTKAASVLPITNIQFDLPLEPVAEEPLPDEPKTAVGADLGPVLRDLAKWQKWTFWLIVVVGAVALLR